MFFQEPIFNTLAVSRRYFQPKIYRFSAKKSKALTIPPLSIKNSFLKNRVRANRPVVKMRAFCIYILLKVSFFKAINCFRRDRLNISF